MWHSPGNALWQQPGSPCEVTPRLWHEECPAASSPFLRDCSSQVAPGPSLRLHIREDANTVAAARLYRAARACPLLYRPPRLRTSSALRLFERSPTCPDGRLLARHRVGRRPARRWPPVPSLPSHRAPPLHASPGGLPHHRRRLARSWPPTPALLLFWALPLAPSTPDLECPCTLRTTAYTSGRFHRRRRVGCRPARGRPPAPPPPLCPASSTSDLECAPCGGCPSSLSSSDLVRPHRRLFTYAPGPPHRHGVVLPLLRMAARAFLAAAPAPSTPDLACLRWRFSFPRSRAYHGRSCTHPPLLPTFHGPSARAALHLSFSLHHVLLCFRGLVTLVLTRACPC